MISLSGVVLRFLSSSFAAVCLLSSHSGIATLQRSPSNDQVLMNSAAEKTGMLSCGSLIPKTLLPSRVRIVTVTLAAGRLMAKGLLLLQILR